MSSKIIEVQGKRFKVVGQLVQKEKIYKYKDTAANRKLNRVGESYSKWVFASEKEMNELRKGGFLPQILGGIASLAAPYIGRWVAKKLKIGQGAKKKPRRKRGGLLYLSQPR